MIPDRRTTNAMARAASQTQTAYRHVFVRDLELMAMLGIYEHEKLKPQRVIINVDLAVAEEGPALVDEISHVVSYEVVVKTIEAIIAQGHVHLVETLAEMIARACLADARVELVRVRVEKPDIIKNARSVGIEIERQQQTIG